MCTLTLVDLQKKYQDKIAVDGVNLTLTNGIYGLLGENGAGKTTLMRMICGVLQPTQGTVICDDISIGMMGGAYRNLLGYLPQDFGYYPDFTAYRFLMYIAALKAMNEKEAKYKIEELLHLVGLWEKKDKKLKTYSGGMLKRIGIVQALLNNPKILLLDEPTSGLDPKERVRFRNIISALGRSRIVILSTHIVTDIEYIADQILMMKKGSFIGVGTVKEISEPVKGHVWECMVSQNEADILDNKFIISNIKNEGNMVKLRIVSAVRPLEHAVSVEETLEDTYLYYLSEGTRYKKEDCNEFV